IRKVRNERRLAIARQLVFLGGNDQDIFFDLSTTFIKIAHQLALTSDPIRLLPASAIVRIVETWISHCRANISRLGSFDLFGHRSTLDDLAQQFSSTERRIAIS